MTGLEEGFTYELAVSAFTEEGEGEKSSWEEARTRPKSVPNIMETPVVKVLAAKMEAWSSLDPFEYFLLYHS